MFFEYAVWGAWAPVLAARLLGPLKMSGKQTGWIYTTLPLACIVSPLIAGQLADHYLNLEWILAGAHLIAAVLMFVAVRQKTFGGLFLTMLGWSFCYRGHHAAGEQRAVPLRRRRRHARQGFHLGPRGLGPWSATASVRLARASQGGKRRHATP